MHTSPTENAIEGTVEVTEPLGDEQIVDVSVGSEADGELELTVKVPNTHDVERGDDVWLTVHEGLVHGFDRETGGRITGPTVDSAREEDRRRGSSTT